MTRSSSRMRLLGVLLLLALCIAPALAQSVTFRFNPPHGTKFSQTVKTTTTRQTSGEKTLTQIVESLTHVAVAKTAKGFTHTLTPGKTTATLNGKPIPMSTDELKNTKLTYVLDKQGKFVTVQGLDALLKKFIAKLPKEKQAEARKKLTTAPMIAQRKAEWENEVGRFIGKTVKIGDTWTDTDNVPLPTGGTVSSKVIMKFDKLVTVNGRKCIHTTSTLQSDPDALKDAMNAEFKQRAPKDGPNKGKYIKVVDLDVTGTSERVIDPATLLYYAESTARTTKVTMSVPGKGNVTITTSEKQAWTFKY